MSTDSSLVWFITGTSTGLGLALAQRALARGERVIATARSLDGPGLTALRAAADPARLRLLALDVSAPPAELRTRVAEAVACWGRVDVVVNNAGCSGTVFVPSEEMGPEDVMSAFTVNFLGVVNVTTAFLPYLREQGGGTVVIVGSRSAYRNEFAATVGYSASKAAVHSYGETLSAEVRPFNIRVCIVAPGTFDAGGLPSLTKQTPPYAAAHEVMRTQIVHLRAMGGKGDPSRGMDAVIDVVRGEGRAAPLAAGGKWPLWLVLGEDAQRDINARLDRMKETLSEWAVVGSDLGYQHEKAETTRS
ncbi:NAD-P-binding protein [Gloeopeniophorella convolvens]|nr:NAD-P-binding protein [Gloeopeniophorella convolvens]